MKGIQYKMHVLTFDTDHGYCKEMASKICLAFLFRVSLLYLAMVGFEPTLNSTAAPSNTETTVIPSRPLRSLKKELSWPRCITRRIGLLGFVVLSKSFIYKEYLDLMDTEAWK